METPLLSRGRKNHTREDGKIQLYQSVRLHPDAVLDKRLTQRQVVEVEPYKIDNNRLIPQVIDAIRTYDLRLVRAITAFEEALNIPYVDPELIHMHARRLRLIGAALGGKIEWLIRFMEEKRPERI